jgi:hypothetical protein
LGSVYSTIANDPVIATMFGPEQQARDFATINLLNSFSVLTVLALAYAVCGKTYDGSPHKGLHGIIDALQPLRRPLLALSGIALFIQFLSFPIPNDLILRNVVEKLSLVVPLAIVLAFSAWRQLPAFDRLFALVVLASSFFFGLVSASKTAALFPLVGAVAGYFLGGRKVICAAFTLITLGLYPTLTAIVDAERTHWDYDPVMNSLAQRLDILMQALTAEGTRPSGGAEGESNPLIRFSHAPYQAYLINEWNEGRPGNSLHDSWTALIPRVLWPEKPIITRFGTELYATIFKVEVAKSHQAPTYTGEAFWNYGWVGVVVVSILLGLQLGWFSRKWLELSFGQTTRLGILIFSLPVVLNAWAVETWITPSYVGGTVTLVVLIKAADWAMSCLIGAPVRKTPILGGARS